MPIVQWRIKTLSCHLPMQLTPCLMGFLLCIAMPALRAALNSEPLLKPISGTTAFEPVDATTSGILFTNTLGEFAGASNRVLFNGSGLALGDVDGDGWVDMFFCGIDTPNQLYRNQGNWQFERQTLPEAMALPGFATRGACLVDINADTRLDLLLTTVGGGCRAFLNQGDWQWVAAPDNAGLANQGGASSMAVADVDGDGDLDLYVTFNRTDDIRDMGRVNLRRVGGQLVPPESLKDRILVHQGQIHEYGEPDALYLNDGRGRFRPASWTDGTFRSKGKALDGIPRDWGLSATFRDLNGDLAPDLYVCNDYWTPDRVWINDGKGGFDALDPMKLRISSASSMGVDMADVNGDGLLDLFVVDMLSRSTSLRKRQQPAFNALFSQPQYSGSRQQVMHNTLLIQDESGAYTEAAHAMGLEASDWSWGPIFMDVDLDGDADLLVSAGYPHDVQDLDAIAEIARLQHSWERYQDPAALKEAFSREMMEHYRLYPTLELPMIGFENTGQGRYVERTQEWGLNHEAVHQGFATADLDGDGDQDLVVNDLNGPPSLFRNLARGRRVKVRLVGREGNHQAVGVQVILQAAGMPSQIQEVLLGGRYLSSGDPAMTFGIPDGVTDLSLTVRWRDGYEQVLHPIEPGRSYLVKREREEVPFTATKQSTTPWWQWVSSDHMEPSVAAPDPLLAQPLLPLTKDFDANRLQRVDDGDSQWLAGLSMGPQQNQLTSFHASDEGSWEEASMGGPIDGRIRSFALMAPEQLIVMAASNQPQGSTSLRMLAWPSGESSDPIEGPEAGSTLALGPLHGERGLAVLAGGNAKPGQWPISMASRLLEWQGNALQMEKANQTLIGSLGMVHDALWSDLNQDGFPELLVASPWSAIKVFENRKGLLHDVSEDWGFSPYKGFWLSLTTLDVNGDGRLDVVAGNLGRNTPWQASKRQPFELAYGHFSHPLRTDVIETISGEDGQHYPIRMLDDIGQHLPFFFQSVANYAAYSQANLKQLMGNRYPLIRWSTAQTFESMCFINRGDGSFEASALPERMQWGAITRLLPVDLDSDGIQDLAWIENQLQGRAGLVSPNRSRVGWLHGAADGSPRFKTGLLGLRDQSPVDWILFDHDPSKAVIKLAVRHQNGMIEVYQHQNPGHAISVIFEGKPSNPGALGAQWWLVGNDGRQSGTYEVRSDWVEPIDRGFAMSTVVDFKPIILHVRWPGGALQEIKLADQDSTTLRVVW